MACTQCGRRAIINRCGYPFCIDCNLKIEQAMQMQTSNQQIQDASQVEYLKLLVDQMDTISGVYSRPRVQASRPVRVMAGNMTFNNIKVDRSIVGSINTGEIKKLDVAINHVRSMGTDQRVANALSRLTQAVLDEQTIAPQNKDAILEHLSLIANQAALPGDRRQKSIGHTLIAGLERLLSAAANLATLWMSCKPALDTIFK